MEKNTSLTYVRVLDAPGIDISPAVDEITVRNELMIQSQEMLNIDSTDYPDAVSDAVWGNTLARLAPETQGLTAMYQIITTKLWVPQQRERRKNTRSCLHKRQRLRY